MYESSRRAWYFLDGEFPGSCSGEMCLMAMPLCQGPLYILSFHLYIVNGIKCLILQAFLFLRPYPIVCPPSGCEEIPDLWGIGSAMDRVLATSHW